MRYIGKRPEYDSKLIGKKLKILRRAKGLTVEEVRQYLCLGSVQAVYKYENGNGYPNADTMFALMELYGAELYDVVARPKCSTPRMVRLGQGSGVDYCYCEREMGMTWSIHCSYLQEKKSEALKRYCELGGWAT